MANLPKNRKRLWWRVAIFSAIGIGGFAIIVPNFVICGRDAPAAFRKACINNLLQIDGAKKQWATDNNADPGSLVVESEIAEYIKHGMPSCPKGGNYTIGKTDEAPRCSIPDHLILPR